MPPDEAISDLEDTEAQLAERLDGSHYRDDVLRLLFICCHPELPNTQQIALALRIVSGLSVRQIARAFLISEIAMGSASPVPRLASRARVFRLKHPVRLSAPSAWRRLRQ